MSNLTVTMTYQRRMINFFYLIRKQREFRRQPKTFLLFTLNFVWYFMNVIPSLLNDANVMYFDSWRWAIVLYYRRFTMIHKINTHLSLKTLCLYANSAFRLILWSIKSKICHQHRTIFTIVLFDCL